MMVSMDSAAAENHVDVHGLYCRCTMTMSVACIIARDHVEVHDPSSFGSRAQGSHFCHGINDCRFTAGEKEA